MTNSNSKRLLDSQEIEKVLTAVKEKRQLRANLQQLLTAVQPTAEGIVNRYPLHIRDELLQEVMVSFWLKADKIAESFDPKRGRLSSYIYHFLSVTARVLTLAKLRKEKRFIPITGLGEDSELRMLSFNQSHPAVCLNLKRANGNGRGEVNSQEEMKAVKEQIERLVKIRFAGKTSQKKALRIFYALCHGCKVDNANFPKLTRLVGGHLFEARMVFTSVASAMRELHSAPKIEWKSQLHRRVRAGI